MIELCLHLPTITECKNIKSYLSLANQNTGQKLPRPEVSGFPIGKAIFNARKLFLKILRPLLEPDCKVSRVYFGVEFCQRVIPALDDLKAALEIAELNNLKFTLLTPYVTDGGIESLSRLFAYLENFGMESEIVVNDFGVLKLIHDNYPKLKPVYGRLMNKMSRMPRFAKDMPQRILPGQLKFFQECSLVLPHYQKFLSNMGVSRVEFDLVPQGIKTDFSGSSFSAGFYYPWSYITTGRVCEIGSLDTVPENKFRLDKPCGRQCRDYYMHLYNDSCDCEESRNSMSVASSHIFQKGNTIFMLCEAPRASIKNLFTHGFDRVIYEPCFPI